MSVGKGRDPVSASCAPVPLQEMDPDVSVLLECAVWRGLAEAEVQVEVSESFNRQTDAALESHIEEVWAKRVTREPWLFNGSKFRLHSFTFDSSKFPPSQTGCQFTKHLPCVPPKQRQPTTDGCDRGEEERRCPEGEGAFNPTPQCTDGRRYQQGNGDCDHPAFGCLAGVDPGCGPGVRGSTRAEAGPRLTLRLGLTSYKDFLGTNWSERAGALRQRGETELNDPCGLLAQPLGVGGVLCTSDGKVVLIRRSQRVAEAGGLLDIPGGHPEPQAVCPCVSDGVSQDPISIAVVQRSPKAVVSEIFSSVCAEIRDEVNVPLGSLGGPVLMGVALNHTSAGRPSAEFYVSCSLTSEEVRELYWRGGAEANESTDIVFLSTKVRDRIHHSQIIVTCQPFVQTENGPLQNPSVCFYKMCSFFIVLSLCNNAGAVAVGQLQAPVVRALSFGQGSCPALSTRQA
ncbi:uridine diphosphate glucose pyrophosphatase NUDT22 isoform X4 [Gadus chalcogrammus]|uniref:uridine diphosphate glucose pyrophosphatase NUDT22 isoform X4 n=1 Tax=Gadus chalcogrammus TaxID=1042646 RepID=UPI0024C4D189|nr:uridine diphosphate glucose pyrophosphatase NUDT22 isoform X4 [Gadus chalcogrammus]